MADGLLTYFRRTLPVRFAVPAQLDAPVVRVFNSSALRVPMPSALAVSGFANRTPGPLPSSRNRRHRTWIQPPHRIERRDDRSRRCRPSGRRAGMQNCLEAKLSSVVGSIFSPTPFPASPPATAPTAAPTAADKGPANGACRQTGGRATDGRPDSCLNRMSSGLIANRVGVTSAFGR